MELEPLKQWYCDSCGTIIESIEDGWMEWHSNEYGTDAKGFRIVHHRHTCMYRESELARDNRHLSDNHLINFLGVDGLVHLLHLMEHQMDKKSSELIEVTRRLHIPYHEEGRRYLHQERQQGINTLSQEMPNGLQRLIEEYADQ